MLLPLSIQLIPSYHLPYLFVTTTSRGNCEQWVRARTLGCITYVQILAQSLLSYVITGNLFILSDVFPICKMRVIAAFGVVMRLICNYHFSPSILLCMCVVTAGGYIYLSIYIYTHTYAQTKIYMCLCAFVCV